jgi:hypothetical protein
LHVTIDGVTVRPALAFGSWLAVKPMGNATMVMGEVVVTTNETNPVLRTLHQNGIAVRAPHDHKLDHQQRTVFVQFRANKGAVQLAQGPLAALDRASAPTVNSPGIASSRPIK